MRGFAARPRDVERWVRAPKRSINRTPNAEFTARLTTPAPSGRVKIAAFQRGVSVAEMLRALHHCGFTDDGRAAS